MAQKEAGPKIFAQVLIYPILTNDLIPDRYERSPDKKLLSYGNMQWFWEQYLANTKDGNSELASPLKAKSVKLLPRALIMTAEHDALRLEGEEYAKKLQKSGVDAVYKCYPQVIHGFLDIPVPSTEVQIALNDIKDFLNTV
jgi:acetyl esterase